MEIFEIKNLTFSYPEREKNALDDICLKIDDGEFIVICGKSGSGKSTLLRHLKPSITPHGKTEGQILFSSMDIKDISLKDEAQKIGYVLQNPDNQIVTDKVWHELSFGLESLSMKKEEIRLRTAEMASFFGISDWFYKDVNVLSGGQKQLLNLASIMAMQPKVLILDEPTSQLDPIAATEFLDTVAKINRELGTTIIITEHRLEEVFPMADRAIVIENGKIIANDSPKKVGEILKNAHNEMFLSMPSAMRIYAELGSNEPCPITVKEGRNFLSELLPSGGKFLCKHSEKNFICENAIEFNDVWFKYEKNDTDVIKGLSLKIKKGSFHSIVGSNGAGKTTALSLISGINKPYSGKILINGKKSSKYSSNELFSGLLGVLPQNPQALFVKNTVLSDLEEMLTGSSDEKLEKIEKTAKLTEITDFFERHPYDLSVGEQQRVALTKILLLNPKILLLDEPTKGLDNSFKKKLSDIIRKLCDSGVTVLMVSHDIEFAAKYTDFCSMFFDGTAVATDETRRFFSGNSFYTTASNRMSRHIIDGAVTEEEVIEICKKNTPR
ncbi:MAG: energy-coupling factor transporter ATPase [Oscillospiraceae bacterium]